MAAMTGDHRDLHQRVLEDVEPLAVQHVGLDVDHDHPDPHGRQDLDQGQAPVDEQGLRTPWNSMAKPPTSRASGASHRLRRLRASTAASTVSSSPWRTASTRRREQDPDLVTARAAFRSGPARPAPARGRSPARPGHRHRDPAWVPPRAGLSGHGRLRHRAAPETAYAGAGIRGLPIDPGYPTGPSGTRRGSPRVRPAGIGPGSGRARRRADRAHPRPGLAHCPPWQPSTSSPCATCVASTRPTARS